MKSGQLNFLEPSGHVQACNGTDLPFNTTDMFKVRVIEFHGLLHLCLTQVAFVR